MKKSIKNTIMIGMAAVLIGTSAVTFGYASDKGQNMPMISQKQQFGQQDNSQGQNPLEDFGSQNKNSQGGRPEMPEQNGRQQNSKDNQQPPENNNQQDSQNNQQPPQSNGSQNDAQQNQPPAQQNENQNSADDSKAQSSEPNSSGTSINSETAAIQVSKGAPQQMNRPHGKALSVICYCFMALQLGIVVAILLYLAFSEFNKLSFNQTLSKFKK
ncbi:MAG: hypothetical protein IKF64_00640 [Eubacterium sp.]|nr:hypothetical protein [Eubacterium sp.]